MTTSVSLSGYYDYRLVALSVFIAVLAAYAALDLAGRVTTSRGYARVVWLCGGAFAMGTGIWAMHYIGMEAYHLPVPVKYDWPTVLLSLIAAILAAGVALFTVSRPTKIRARMIAGGIFMGSGIAAMHYIGMEAMRLPAMCMYSPWLVGLSIVLAIAISFVALELTFALRGHVAQWSRRKISSALAMGLAIPTMHYVGMSAAGFMPLASMNGSLAHAVDVSSLNVVSIALVTVLILGIAFTMSILDRQFSLQAERLKTSQSQLQMIFDNMSEGILVLDKDGKTVLCNKAAVQLLSIPEELDAYSKVVEQFEAFLPNGEPLPPAQWPTVRALRGEFVQNFEILYRRKSDGETGAREITAAPVKDAHGGPDQIIVTYRDITERWRIDEARNRLAAIVESSEDAIIGKNETGIVTSWNRGAEKLFGYTAAQMVGRSVKDLHPPGSEHEEDEILLRIGRGETVDHFETVRAKKNGELVNVSLTISPIKDAKGNVIGASKIARNITEKKQMERQLQQSQKMEAIGQLTGGIAHDFNNLLGVMVGNLDLLERLVAGNEAALKRVQTAQKAGARGADLTRRLLAFCSNVELKPAPTELHQSIHNMVELSGALGPDINISTHLDNSIPPVLVDAAGLESALLNMAVNARDAMPNGGTISVATELCTLEENYPPVLAGELKPGRYASIAVSDTGCGMSKETMSRVFEPFFTTKPRGKGTGLGLAMVYGFVKQSGGTVRIYSEPGIGTTLTLYLPLAQPVSESHAVVPLAHASPKLVGKVLVVDDEPDLLEIATAYLMEMGYTAYRAQDGISALEVIEQHQDIDLIVTDIMMPGGMNGVELAAKVRQRLPQIKLIYCSGFPADAMTERKLSLVDGPLLHKPYQRTGFGAMVSAAMEGR
jgi:PAS domain S-box-containing protein